MRIPINLNKKLSDFAIEKIREKLQSLTWLDEVYPAVQVGVRENGDTYPQLYIQAGGQKILDLTPDTAKKSYIFFEKGKTEVLGEENIYDISLIWWGQLDAIDNTRQYDYTTELVAEIVTILKDLGAYNITIDYSGAFANYNLHDTRMQFLMYPYSSFRVDFSIIFSSNC